MFPFLPLLIIFLIQGSHPQDVGSLGSVRSDAFIAHLLHQEQLSVFANGVETLTFTFQNEARTTRETVEADLNVVFSQQSSTTVPSIRAGYAQAMRTRDGPNA
jgi:hypothetical protein